MASAYSIARNYSPYVQPYNLDLLQKGLEYKQQKYDVNSAAIQSQIDQLSNLKLAKGADQEYLNARLNTLVQQVNKFGAVDLSSTGVTKNIQNHVKQALDQNVMTAYIGSQNLANLRKEIEDVRKNKPKSYSSQNEAYALRGAVEWLNDGQVGSSYGGGSYIPYTDVAGKQQKALKELYKDSESVVTVPETLLNPATGKMEPTGRMITKKFKGLQDEEISSIFESGLSSQDRQQMEIDAWATYNQNPAAAVDMYNRYTDNRRGELTKRLEAAQQSGNSEHIKLYTNALENLNTQVEDMRDNPNQIGMFLQKENMMGGLKTAFRKRQVGFEYKVDTAFYNHRADARAVTMQRHTFRKDQANLQLSRDRLKLDQDKFELQEDKFDFEKKQALKKDSAGGGLFSFLQNDPNVTGVFNAVEAFEDDFVDSEQSLNSLTQNMLNTQLKNDALEIERDADTLVQTKGLDRDYARAVVVNKKLSEQKLTNQSVELQEAFLDYNDKLDRQKVFHENSKKALNRSLEEKLPIIFNSSNSNVKEKYEAVLGFKMESFEQLTPERKKELTKAVLADVVNTKVANTDEKDLQLYVDQLSDLMGEKITLKKTESERILETRRGRTVIKEPSFEIEGSARVKELLNKDSNLTPKSGIFDVGILNPINIVSPASLVKSISNFNNQNSITDDPEFGGLMDGTIVDKARKDALSEVVVENKGKVAIAVLPNTPEQRAVVATMNLALSDPDTQIIKDGVRKPFEGSSTKFFKELNLTKNTHLKIVPEQNDPGFVEISTPTGTNILVRRTILDQNLANVGAAPIDYGSISTKDVFIANKSNSKKPVKYIDRSTFNRNEKFYREEFSNLNLGRRGVNPLLTLTPNLTMATLKARHSLTEEQVADAEFITKSAEGLLAELDGDGGNIVTEMKNSKGVPLFSVLTPLSGFENTEEAEKHMKRLRRIQIVAPQYFVFTMLDNVIQGENSGIGTEYTLKGIRKQITDVSR